MIKLSNNPQHTKFKFNGGELNIQIPSSGNNQIYARIQSSDDLIELCLLNNAIKENWGHMDVFLDLVYMPYARQDRVCNEGEALGVKVAADIINSCGFRRVNLYDPHSDVAHPLIHNSYIIDQYNIWNRFANNLTPYKNNESCVVVSPDHGAMKKSLKIGNNLKIPTYCANKIRDTKTGRILDIKIDADNLEGKNILIFDDICDGGATFIELGHKLRELNPASMSLFITHGIFSNQENINILAGIYNGGIHCFDSWIKHKDIMNYCNFFN